MNKYIAKGLEVLGLSVRDKDGLFTSGAKGSASDIIGIYYAVLQKRADAFKQINNYFVNKQGERVNSIEFDFLFSLPNKPYKQTWIDIKELVSLSLNDTGNAYLWFDYGGTNKPLNVYTIPPFLMTVEQSGDGLVYIYDKGGVKQRIIPNNEIVHFKNNFITKDQTNWLFNGYAKGKESVKQTIDTEKFVNEELKNLYKNSGLNVILGETDPNANIPMNYVESVSKGLKEAFPQSKLLLAEYGINFRTLENGSGSHIDKAIRNNMLDDTVTKICIAYNVPTSLLLNDYANYATAKQSYAEFRNGTIEAEMLSFEAQLNLFFAENGYDLIITHDPYEYQDETIEIQRIDMLLRNNVISINEARILSGFEEVESNKVLDKLSSLSPIVANKLADSLDINELRSLVGLRALTTEEISARNPQPLPSIKAVSKGVSGGLGTTDKTSTNTPTVSIEEIENKMFSDYWYKWNKDTDNASKIIAKDVERVFEQMQKDLIKKLSSRAKSLVTKEFNVNLDIDIEKYLKLFEKLNNKQLEMFAYNTIEELLKDLDIDVNMNDYATGIKEATKESLDKIKTAFETVDNRIKEIVNAIKDSEGFAELTEVEFRDAIKEALNKEFQGTITNRIDTIARTTSNTASNKAKDYAIEKNELVKQWVYTFEAETPRTSHQNAHKQIANKNGSFNVGGKSVKYPTGFGIASEDINCHCTIIARKKQ